MCRKDFFVLPPDGGLCGKALGHIQKPLDILVSGVKRIQEGNLDAPIGYVVPDEFKPACDAVDEMAARLKTSLEAQSRQQQQKQELIAGISHDLKSPLTSIRACTEVLLGGVAKDEQTQARYLQTIYAKETEIETLVNRLFSFAKLDLSEAPAKPEALEISGTFAEIAAGFEAEGLDVRQDLNLHACAMEPKGDVTLVKGLKPPECFIIALQNTYQQSEFSGING